MGQTCCISTDKIDQFIPEVKDVVLTDWKETIKLVLKYNNDDEDVSNRLQKHEIDILQEIFYGNSKLPNIVNGSNNYNSKRMLLSVSQLSSKFPLLSLDANDNDALFLGVTDKRISLGFSCRNLALAFRLLSYVMSPFSDSTELLRTQLINPSSISIDFRDFANTLSSCGLAKSSRREHLVFLFLLFADQLTSLHGKSMPLNSSDARNPTESASHRQSNTEPRLFLPLINGKVTKNRPPERNRDTERTEKRTSPFGLEPKDDRSQLRKSTSVSDFSADSTIGTESVADGGTSATTNDVNDNLQHLYELALSRSSFIRLIRFLALGPITRHMSWKTFESKLSRGDDQSRCLADQETTRQSTTFGVASGSINTENEAISDAVDYWSLHVNSAYSEDTLKRLESDQDLNLHWPLSLVEFLQFADNAVLDIVDVASDVEVVGKTTPRPDIDQNSNFASVLFRKAAIADALSTFCMFPHPQHEADLAVAAAERGHGSRNSDDQVFLVDDRWWTAWCNYTSVIAEYDETIALVVGLRANAATSTCHNHPRPGCIDNNRLLCADTGSLLPFIQKKPFGGSDTSPERASYVLLSSSLWALLHGLYRSHSAIPRRLLRQANNFSVELDPMLVDVHWYIGGGYASEIASDIFSVCPCGISHEKCNEVLCSISDILKRVNTFYGLSELSKSAESFRVWTLVSIPGRDGHYDLPADGGLCIPAFPFLSFEYLNAFRNGLIGRTNGRSRLSVSFTGYQQLFWRLITKPDSSASLSSVYKSWSESGQARRCKVMLECQTSDGKWPLDIIIPSLDRLWKPVVDSSLPLEAAEKLKRGDEVIAKDSRGRRLAANVVSVSATPHHASTGVVDSLPVLLRFRFAGKQWEEQCSVDLRDIIILPPPSTQGELEIVKLLQDRLIDPVDEGTSFSRKRQSLFNILIESKSISNAVSSGNSMNPPSNSVNVNSSSRQSDNTSTRSSTARDSLVSGLLSTVSAMVPFGAGRISASLPGNRLSKGSNSTQISSPAVVSPSEESLVLASGFTGLYNVGNTCYLNASLQALSHAPLLPPYFLSGRFRKDLNRSNILGTGGRLAEEFANLEQLMWSVEGSYRIVSPMEFKRVLQRSKPQFSGNDQQDSQEFLAELLDALHEDLNRFDRSKESRKLRLDSTLSQESFKKLVHYDASVDQVGNMKQLSITDQGNLAWTKHLSRNRSVIVELFQGQQCTTVTCPDCRHRSLSFDPFMSLSLPLPKQHEVVINILILRRLPRIRLGSLDAERGHLRISLSEVAERVEYLKNQQRLVRCPIRMSLNFPRLTDIAAVKLAVCEKLAKLNSESDLSPLSPENLCAVQLAVSVSNTNKTTSYGEIARFLDDKIPLANIVETAVANSNSPIAPASSSSTTASAREFTLMLSENCKHLGFVASLSLSTLENALATPSSRPSSIQVPNMGCYEDHLEYAFPDLAEGDLVLDIDNVLELKGSLPLEFHDLIVGKRVDALDHRGQWFSGSVAELWEVMSDQLSVIESLESSEKVGMPRTIGLHIRIHFDNFSSKWDEWFGQNDFESGRICAVYSHAPRRLKVHDVVVLNRLDREGQRFDIVGVPFLVQCENFRSCLHLYRHVVEQALRFASPAEIDSFLDAMRSAQAKAGSSSFEWPNDFLPFTVCITSIAKVTMVQSSDESAKLVDGKEHVAWEGTDFPRDRHRPFCNLHHQRLVITIDWKNSLGKSRFSIQFDDHESFTRHAKELVDINAVRDRRLGLSPSVSLEECLFAFAGAEEQLDENSWNCDVCKKSKRGIVKTSIVRSPDVLILHLKRFGMTARWREKIRTRVIFPFTSLDLSPYLAESLESKSILQDGAVENLYDLYAVVNHLGGMSGGHYTAYVKCCPPQTEGLPTDPTMEGALSSDGSSVLDAARYTQYAKNKAASLDGSWYLFDDDAVRPVPLQELENLIVSESAYILFYRRRVFKSSTITLLSP